MVLCACTGKKPRQQISNGIGIYAERTCIRGTLPLFFYWLLRNCRRIILFNDSLTSYILPIYTSTGVFHSFNDKTCFTRRFSHRSNEFYCKDLQCLIWMSLIPGLIFYENALRKNKFPVFRRSWWNRDKYRTALTFSVSALILYIISPTRCLRNVQQSDLVYKFVSVIKIKLSHIDVMSYKRKQHFRNSTHSWDVSVFYQWNIGLFTSEHLLPTNSFIDTINHEHVLQRALWLDKRC